MKALNMKNSFKEIKRMSHYTYSNLVRKKCEEGAFEYLVSKRGSKGREIEYMPQHCEWYMVQNGET